MQTGTFEERFNANGIDICIVTHSGRSENPGMHYHDHTNLVFILQGCCFEKRKHSSYNRTASDLVFLHAGEMHETIIGQWPTRYISLNIEPRLLDYYALDELRIIQALTRSPDAKFLMLKILYELKNPDTFTAGSIELLFMQYATLSRQISYKSHPPAWIKIIQQYLHDNWNENISLNDLAIAAGVNPITISKYFPHYFASTLGAYRRKLKIEQSLALIKKGNASLSETTYACGFADQSHFIRNFREFTSLSPGQYRAI